MRSHHARGADGTGLIRARPLGDDGSFVSQIEVTDVNDPAIVINAPAREGARPKEVGGRYWIRTSDPTDVNRVL